MLQDSCINYNRTRLTNRGYGRYRFQGKMQLAHRITYIQHHDLSLEDIKGKVIRHRCDNPRCINPEHLEIGTQQDNIQDMVDRNRFNPCRGEANVLTKLTDDIVREIRKVYIPGSSEFGYSALARKYNTTDVSIRNAIKGRTWRHLV